MRMEDRERLTDNESLRAYLQAHISIQLKYSLTEPLA